MYDAASLLWRYQIYGCAQNAIPWSTVGDLAARMTAQPGMAFVDANAALALAAAKDEVAFTRLIDGLRALDAQGHPTAGPVVLPLVQGIWAFARGAYDEAIRWIEPIADQIVRIGGSNAQREVFEDTLLEAYVRAGHYAPAEALLRQRLGRRPSARDLFWLGRAQLGNGQLDNARITLQEARQRWAEADPEAEELTALERAQHVVEAMGSSEKSLRPATGC
jgi:tetratricopeptide (TPR) repeat protein